MMERNPYLAAAISLLTPGLGHVYAGQIMRFLAVLLGVHVIIVVLGLMGFLATYRGALAYTGLMLFLMPFGVVDSFFAAKRGRTETLKWTSRWYFYLGFIAFMVLMVVGHRLLRPLLGFDFYQVKLADVPPVISKFDVVVIDTKAFVRQAPQKGEVVLVRRPGAGVFIGRVSQPASATTFSYVVGTEGTEQSAVPLDTIVGMPTYVFYSRASTHGGKQIY